MHSIYFARHGETVWNVENKICGMTDSPLTEKGRQFHENTMLALHQTDEYVASLLTEEENTELLRLLNKLYLGLK